MTVTAWLLIAHFHAEGGKPVLIPNLPSHEACVFAGWDLPEQYRRVRFSCEKYTYNKK